MRAPVGLLLLVTLMISGCNGARSCKDICVREKSCGLTEDLGRCTFACKEDHRAAKREKCLKELEALETCFDPCLDEKEEDQCPEEYKDWVNCPEN